MNQPHRYRRAQAGFSIVEVMVALMVLAVGMLGIASLYVTTLRSSGSAISRMQAVNLAGDLADRIRANRRAGRAYQDLEVEHDCSGTTNCTADDMAANDKFLWQKQIVDALGLSGLGDVTFTERTGTTPDNYVITVSWRERGNDGSGTSTRTSTTDDVLSYQLTMQVEP